MIQMICGLSVCSREKYEDISQLIMLGKDEGEKGVQESVTEGSEWAST